MHEIAVAVFDSAQDVFKVMLGVIRMLVSVVWDLEYTSPSASLVLTWGGGIDTLHLGHGGFQPSQHLVEGVILQHQDDDMPYRIGGHRIPLFHAGGILPTNLPERFRRQHGSGWTRFTSDNNTQPARCGYPGRSIRCGGLLPGGGRRRTGWSRTCRQYTRPSVHGFQTQDDQERATGIVKWTARRENREGFWRHKRFHGCRPQPRGRRRVGLPARPVPAAARTSAPCCSVQEGHVRPPDDGASRPAAAFTGSWVSGGVREADLVFLLVRAV